MTFGEFVRTKREEASLSQRSFAALLGISPVYTSYFESGKRKPPKRELLLKIAEALHLNKKDTEMMLYLAAQISIIRTTPMISSVIYAVTITRRTRCDWRKNVKSPMKIGLILPNISIINTCNLYFHIIPDFSTAMLTNM